MALHPDHLERDLVAALHILGERLGKDNGERIVREYREIICALYHYGQKYECAGGEDHDWGFIEDCNECGAPDGDCQNYDTIWCPTCLGCKQ